PARLPISRCRCRALPGARVAGPWLVARVERAAYVGHVLTANHRIAGQVGGARIAVIAVPRRPAGAYARLAVVPDRAGVAIDALGAVGQHGVHARPRRRLTHSDVLARLRRRAEDHESHAPARSGVTRIGRAGVPVVTGGCPAADTDPCRAAVGRRTGIPVVT